MNVYFAYGTNMDRELMGLRCPRARALGTGRLDGWRLLVTVDGYVSIMREPGACVHGVLWRVGPRDIAALNYYEELGSGLYRRRTLPVLAGTRRVSAYAYVGRSLVPGRPQPGHMQVVCDAAQCWNLPAAYRAELQRWDNLGRQRARPPDTEAPR